MKKIKNLIIFLYIPTLCFLIIMCFIIYYDNLNKVNKVNEEEIIKYYDSSHDIDDFIIGNDNKKSLIYSLTKENNIYKVTYKNSDKNNKTLTYDKAIKITHFDYNDDSKINIPHYIYYSEYNEEYSMTFSGKLEFISLNAYKNFLIAEYSGSLYDISENNEYK